MGKEQEPGQVWYERLIEKTAGYLKDFNTPGAPPVKFPEELYPFGKAGKLSRSVSLLIRRKTVIIEKKNFTSETVFLNC